MSETDAPFEREDHTVEENHTVEYDGPAGGWGSLRGIASIFGKEWDSPAALDTLRRQNKPKGFMCVSCSWAKPADYHAFEFCENGAKATLWELTSRRCTPDFFAKHTVSELRGWNDYDLEQQGRLTHPMRYDAATDHYVPCEWDEAFRAIGSQLRSLDPKSVIFYSSGRASLETSYLYALFARLYGNNNLPDSSNMCHETTSVALKKLDRRRGRHRRLRRSFELRRDVLLRPEYRLEQSAVSASAAGCSQARRSDHHLQSGAGERAGDFHQSAKSVGNADRQGNQDQQSVPSGQDRRRHRGDARHLQACLRRRRQSQGGRQARARHALHRAAHTWVRGFRSQGSQYVMG